jgi:dTDP-4-dehydrorhamnose 3,5-epimerase
MVNSKINGIIFSKLKQISDVRGSVLHMLRNDSPEFEKFGECYFSEIFPGRIKAWKRHNLQTQNLAVPIGLIKIVFFDSRKKSITKDILEEHIIGRPKNYYRLKIPPGIWYGFTCLSKEKALIVNCSNIPHQSAESEVLEINDTSIPYSWNT